MYIHTQKLENKDGILSLFQDGETQDKTKITSYIHFIRNASHIWFIISSFCLVIACKVSLKQRDATTVDPGVAAFLAIRLSLWYTSQQHWKLVTFP